MTVAIGARRFRGANWIGMASLMRRQMKSGLADVNYTILGPVISNALYLLVFTTATATLSRIDPDTILAFIAPGLICFAIAEKAYEVAGSVLISEKHERTHFDWMMAPLTPIERTLCFIVTSTLCGIFVGLTVWATTILFVPFEFAHPWAILVFGLGAGMFHGLVGTLLGIWAEKWDQYSAMHTFVVLPLSFPAGIFNRVSDWPEPAQLILRFNPIFYMIDGFRYGVTGEASADLFHSLAVLVLVNGALAFWAYRWLATGYRLKA